MDKNLDPARLLETVMNYEQYACKFSIRQYLLMSPEAYTIVKQIYSGPLTPAPDESKRDYQMSLIAADTIRWYCNKYPGRIIL